VRVQHPAASRLAPADRNPIPRFYKWAEDLSGATKAFTEDWSYTVPTGKKCLVEAVQANAYNNSTNPLNGVCSSLIDVLLGASWKARLVEARLSTGRTASFEHMQLGLSVTLQAGYKIRGASESAGNVGNPIIATSFAGTEYDA